MIFQWSPGFLSPRKSLWREKIRVMIFFLLFAAEIVGAQGIAVVPNELRFDEKTEEIEIFNLNEAETEYLVFAKNNPEFFEIQPDKILIEKGKSKKVEIRLLNGKNIEDIIYVREINQNKNLISGVGVRVSASKKGFYDGKEIFIGSLVLLGCVLVYVYRVKSKSLFARFFPPPQKLRRRENRGRKSGA